MVAEKYNRGGMISSMYPICNFTFIHKKKKKQFHSSIFNMDELNGFDKFRSAYGLCKKYKRT